MTTSGATCNFRCVRGTDNAQSTARRGRHHGQSGSVWHQNRQWENLYGGQIALQQNEATLQFHCWNPHFLYIESLNDGMDHGRQDETYKRCSPKLNAPFSQTSHLLVVYSSAHFCFFIFCSFSFLSIQTCLSQIYLLCSSPFRSPRHSLPISSTANFCLYLLSTANLANIQSSVAPYHLLFSSSIMSAYIFISIHVREIKTSKLKMTLQHQNFQLFRGIWTCSDSHICWWKFC